MPANRMDRDNRFGFPSAHTLDRWRYHVIMSHIKTVVNDYCNCWTATKRTDRVSSNSSSPQPAKKASDSRFRVRDYPFFFMHWIITKNNQNIGEVVRELGITPQVWRILALLQEKDGVSITELSEASLIDRTLLSRILSELERRGFVQKRENPEDKRYTGIYLAPDGAKMFQRILPIARSQIERAVSGLSAGDLNKLNAILAKIMHNLNRSPYL